MKRIKKLANHLVPTGVLLGLVLGGLLAVGCVETRDPELSPQQAAFKAKIHKVIKQQSARFMPLLDKPHPGPKLQADIDGQFAQGIKNGKPLYYDLAVLSAYATVLAWRSPDPEDLSKTYQGYLGQNYSKFTKLNPVYRDDRVVSFEVFTQYGPGLGLCSPLRQGNQLKGVLCLGFDEDSLKQYTGLTKEQFLAIDFNQ